MLKKLKKILKKNSFIYKLYISLLKFTKLNSDKDPFLFRLYEKIIINNEIKKLEKLTYKNIDIVYDCSVSALTLGDFCDFAMVARFFQKKKFDIRIIFINDNFRDDYYKKNLQKAKLRLDEYKIILKSFVSPKIPIINCNWNNYKNGHFEKNFTFFNSNILSRKPIYHHCFNFLSTILRKEKNFFLNNYLLRKNNFFLNKKINLPKKKYISLGCRYDPISKKGFYERNLKEKEFLDIIKKISLKFKSYKIMIICDDNGKKFFQKVAKKNNLNLLFSKDFSNSFVGDGKIILNSEFFIQFLGGGIITFLIYSKLNFLWFSFPQNHHLIFSKTKYSFWHNKQNIFLEILKRDFNKFLLYLNKIKIT